MAPPAAAGDATWSGGVSGEWGQAGNWVGGVVPDATAVFSATGATTITFPDGAVVNFELVPTSVGTIAFDDGAQAYTFNIGTNNSAALALTGAGIVNNSANQQTFVNGLGLVFLNASSAGNAVISNLSGLDFRDSSSAGTATITNSAGVFLNFTGSSSGGSANITNYNWLAFDDTASAGSAVIDNTATGTVYFSGNAKAGNATIINDGTVSFSDPVYAISSSASSAENAAITNNGVLQFNRHSTAGNATITNNGTVTFARFATGGTAALTNGTSGVVDFSASAGPLFDHALSIGSLAGGGSVYLGQNQLAIGGNDLSTSFAGSIADCGPAGACLVPGVLDGSIVKVGTGTLTLSGTSAYSGSTTVSGGTLVVDGSIASSSGVTVGAGGTLSGVGTVAATTVQSGGVLAPGNASLGTLEVAGDLTFAAGSTYAVDLTPSLGDNTVVTGSAALGGTLQAGFAPSAYLPRDYVVLSAANGLGGSTFDALDVVGAPGLLASLAYSPTEVSIELTAALAQSNGLNANQQAVAGVIDTAFNAGGGIGSGFPALFGLSGGALANGLTQLAGEVAAGTIGTSLQAMDGFLDLMLEESLGRRNGTSPFAFLQQDETPPVASAYADPGSARSFPVLGARQPDFGIWGSVYGGEASIAGDAAGGSNATGENIRGFAGGIDARLGPDTVAGVALSAGSTGWSLDNGLGSGNSNMLQAGVYGRTSVGAGYLSGALAYARHDAGTVRTVTVARIDELAADFVASAVGARVEGGYRLDTPGLDVTPYVAIEALAAATPAYGEYARSGSAQFALDYDARTTTSSRTEIGTGFAREIALDDEASLHLQARVAWAHDFNADRHISAAFRGLPGASFTVDGATPAADSALVSASAEVRFAGGFTLAGRLDGEFAASGYAFSETATFRHAW